MVAMLAVANLPRTLAVAGVLPCLSCSKSTTILQNSNANYHVAKRRRLESTRLGIAINRHSLLPLTSLVLSSPKFFSSNSANNNCWHCGKALTTRVNFCDGCDKLQPLDECLNFYEILGIRKSFTVDTKALTKIFRKLQTQFHPDKYNNRTEAEKEYSADHSSEINKAYRCLLNPVERALYLLDLAGQPLHEGQMDLDPEFLMEIMEVNEELAEATDKESVADIGQKNQKILDELLREADAAFSKDDIKTARDVVAKIKYYNNIYLKVKDYERRHGIMD